MIYTLLWREAEERSSSAPAGRAGSTPSTGRRGWPCSSRRAPSRSISSSRSIPRSTSWRTIPATSALLLPEQRFAGEYTSPVLDARTLASWGRIVWDAAVAAGASVQLQTRSGNTNEPNATWSDWSPFYGKTEEQVLSPKARFLQVKVILRTQTGKSSPGLRPAGRVLPADEHRPVGLAARVPAAERGLPQAARPGRRHPRRRAERARSAGEEGRAAGQPAVPEGRAQGLPDRRLGRAPTRTATR